VRAERSGVEHGRPLEVEPSHRAAARKHPVTEQSEVAVLTSVGGTGQTAWVGVPVPVTDRWKRAVADRPAGGWRRVVQGSRESEQ